MNKDYYNTEKYWRLNIFISITLSLLFFIFSFILEDYSFNADEFFTYLFLSSLFGVVIYFFVKLIYWVLEGFKK